MSFVFFVYVCGSDGCEAKWFSMIVWYFETGCYWSLNHENYTHFNDKTLLAAIFQEFIEQSQWTCIHFFTEKKKYVESHFLERNSIYVFYENRI